MDITKQSVPQYLRSIHGTGPIGFSEPHMTTWDSINKVEKKILQSPVNISKLSMGSVPQVSEIITWDRSHRSLRSTPVPQNFKNHTYKSVQSSMSIEVCLLKSVQSSLSSQNLCMRSVVAPLYNVLCSCYILIVFAKRNTGIKF